MTEFCWLVQGLFQWQALSALATVVAAWVVWKQVGSLSDQVKVQSDQLRLQIYQIIQRGTRQLCWDFPKILIAMFSS